MNYIRMPLKQTSSDISSFRPSQLLSEGEYPFSNYHDNAYVVSLFGNFKFFDSNDRRLVN